SRRRGGSRAKGQSWTTPPPSCGPPAPCGLRRGLGHRGEAQSAETDGEVETRSVSGGGQSSNAATPTRKPASLRSRDFRPPHKGEVKETENRFANSGKLTAPIL